ncbi:hypothetical protein VTI74DRAFT_11530 [Chaetomium olivicolor]
MAIPVQIVGEFRHLRHCDVLSPSQARLGIWSRRLRVADVRESTEDATVERTALRPSMSLSRNLYISLTSNVIFIAYLSTRSATFCDNTACWISGGYNVNLRDPSPEQREAALQYIETEGHKYHHDPTIQPGVAHAFESLQTALKDAWLVIEVVPEKLGLKIDTFAELEALAPADAILASNSSSYKSSQMLDKVGDATKTRILNTHYYMPPTVMIVELMTDGFTAPGIFPFLIDRQKEAGTIPFIARKESSGFIFNRLWAAVKRETLAILAEGVSLPEEVDQMWYLMMVKSGVGPCRIMDRKLVTFSLISPPVTDPYFY